jgi:FKBP-type peptidyl-prolyl cis-trans isomerase
VVIVSRSYTSPPLRALVAGTSRLYPHAFVGTDKRERQKVGKQARAEAELTAHRRAKTRRTVVRAVIGIIVVLAILLAYSSLAGDDSDSETSAADETTTTTAPGGSTTTSTPAFSNPEVAQEVLARGAPDPAPPPADTPPDVLQTETLIEGSGEGAANRDTVVVHYVGKTPDGNVFDQSWEREPFSLTLGQGAVIAGWDQGLVGAKLGERRRLVLGSENAYGAQGTPDGSIPPDTPLAFEVDVLDIVPAGSPAPGG